MHSSASVRRRLLDRIFDVTNVFMHDYCAGCHCDVYAFASKQSLNQKNEIVSPPAAACNDSASRAVTIQEAMLTLFLFLEMRPFDTLD
jgi:hypothetical protein